MASRSLIQTLINCSRAWSAVCMISNSLELIIFLVLYTKLEWKATNLVDKNFNDCTSKSRFRFGHLYECLFQNLISPIFCTVETTKIRSSHRLRSQTKDSSASSFNHQATGLTFSSFINLTAILSYLHFNINSFHSFQIKLSLAC